MIIDQLRDRVSGQSTVLQEIRRVQRSRRNCREIKVNKVKGRPPSKNKWYGHPFLALPGDGSVKMHVQRKNENRGTYPFAIMSVGTVLCTSKSGGIRRYEESRANGGGITDRCYEGRYDQVVFGEVLVVCTRDHRWGQMRSSRVPHQLQYYGVHSSSSYSVWP
jgi:hypothetical protein